MDDDIAIKYIPRIILLNDNNPINIQNNVFCHFVGLLRLTRPTMVVLCGKGYMVHGGEFTD